MLSAVHKFKAINIIHVTFSFLPVIGGAEIMVHNVAKAQKSQGNEVFVLTSWNNWRNNKYDLPYKVLPLLPKTISITKYFNQHNINVNWLLGIQLLAYVFIKKIDVCHLNYAYMEGYAFSRLLKQFKIPTILTSHGGDIQYVPDNLLNETNISWVVDGYVEESDEMDASLVLDDSLFDELDF